MDNKDNNSERENSFEEAEVRGGKMLWNLPRFFEPSQFFTTLRPSFSEYGVFESIARFMDEACSGRQLMVAPPEQKLRLIAGQCSSQKETGGDYI